MAAFLRAINALENIRESEGLLALSANLKPQAADREIKRAVAEIGDSIDVLKAGGLSPDAVAHLGEAKRLAKKAVGRFFASSRRNLTRQAIAELEKARAELVETS